MVSFLREFTAFLLERKKYWLLPVFIVMAMFGGLIVLTKGTAVAPFIYTPFLRAPSCPRGFPVLLRQPGRICRRWAPPGPPPGRTFHPQEIRCQLSTPCGRVLPQGRRCYARGRRLRRLLRQALSEIRAPARNLSHLQPAGVQLIPHGAAVMAARKALPQIAARRRAESARTEF